MLLSLNYNEYLIISIVFSVILTLLIYIYFKTRRNSDLPERFPYESTIKLAIHQSDVNDYLLSCFREIKSLNGKNTWTASFLGLPSFVFTNDIDNITHILKNSFDNYGKGPSIQYRLKGLLGDGIFNSDGDVWYHHRKTSANLFNMNVFKSSVMKAFNKHGDDVIQIIRNKNGKPFDFQALMYKFTLDSIGTIAFGYDIGALKQNKVQFADDFDYAQEIVNGSFQDPLWLLTRFFTPFGWKYFLCVHRLNQYAYKVIQKRREDDIIDSKKGYNEDSKRDLVSLYLERQDPNNPLTDENIRDIILNFIIAGRDTTAQALSWSMYRLSIHPDIQNKVRDEVVSMIGDKRFDQLTYEQVNSLKYLEAFCMEVLRLHPSVPKELKYAFNDDVLPDGTKVYKGNWVSFLPWVMGRTENFWNNCYEFDPLRFFNQPKPSPFIFTAFQAGPRTCLGQNFALLEMKLTLARLVSHFSFALEQDPKSVTYLTTLTLPIKGGLSVSAKQIK